jgi:hypothetical protein
MALMSLIYRIEYRAYPPFFSHFLLKGKKRMKGFQGIELALHSTLRRE